MTWVDRSGARLGTIGQPARILSARISPNGKHVAFIVGESPLGDLWLQELPSGDARQITSGATTAGMAWAPGSDELAVGTAGPQSHLSTLRLDGAPTETRLPTTGVALKVDDWSVDGRWIAYEQDGQSNRTDLWLLNRRFQDTPVPTVSSEGDDHDAVLSPDSLFVAYVQEVAGRPEVHVQPFPRPSAKFRVSQGTSPRWSVDGKELFYVALDGRLMSVPVTIGASFAAEEARPLFDLGASRFQQPAADGQRFLVLAPWPRRDN